MAASGGLKDLDYITVDVSTQLIQLVKPFAKDCFTLTEGSLIHKDHRRHRRRRKRLEGIKKRSQE
jgi:hypothetical protein